MNSTLAYLKDLIEGKDGLAPWSSWFGEHENELQALLKRGAFLRLKQSPLTEIPGILAELGIAFDAHEQPHLPAGPLDGTWIDRSWLTERVSSRGTPSYAKVQAGSYLYEQLLYIIELKREGDELWHFETPEEMGASHVGSSGIALVRDGQVIHAVVQTMS